MATIGDLVVNLGLNRAGFSSGLTSARGLIRGFVSSALPLLAPLTAAFGAVTSVNAARTQIESEKKLQAVLKATAGAAGLSQAEIQSYASDLQKATNYGDELTISSAAVLATFKEIKGDVFKEALASAQDMNAVMGGDLQANVVQLGKALNDPIKGVSALSEVGVSFTQQQKEQIKALQEAGDLMGAQRIILNELKSEFGGAAQAMADPFTQAKNVVGDLSENFGLALLPAMNEVLTMFNSFAGSIDQNFFKKIGDDLAFGIRNGSAVAQIAMIDLLQQIFDFVPGSQTVVQAVVATFAGLYEANKQFLTAMITNVQGAFEDLLSVAKAVTAGIFAAFQAIGQGQNPLSALTDKFVEELASQKDSIERVNPLAAYTEGFAKAFVDVEQMFAKQNLGAMLQDQKSALLQQIAQSEQGRTAKEALAGAVPGSNGPDVTGPTPGDTKAPSNSALQAGTKEAYKAIFEAQRGANNPNKKLEDQNDRMLTIQEQQLTALQSMSGLGGGPTYDVAEGV